MAISAIAIFPRRRNDGGAPPLPARGERERSSAAETALINLCFQ